MTGNHEPSDETVTWQQRLQYWSIIAGVILVLVFLFAMWIYSFVMTTECSFVRFVTFQCERVFR